MVKVFGFMVALAAMVSSANAALLVSYQYAVEDSKDPTEFLNGVAAVGSIGDFNQNQSLQVIRANVNDTSTIRRENFEFSTTSPNSITLSKMTFDTGLTNGGTRAISFTPKFKVGGVDVNSNLYSVTGSGFGAYTVNFLQPFVIGSNTFVATIEAKGATAGSSTSFSLDNVNFNGELVPEPASMAVFGLLGAGLAVRRLRRKA